jgi:membrane-associated protein
VVGGFLWGVGVTTAGYLLGEVVDVDRYLLPVIGLIVLISLTPVLLEMRKARRGSRDEVGSSSPR